MLSVNVGNLTMFKAIVYYNTVFHIVAGKVPQFVFSEETGGLCEEALLDQTVPSLGSPANTSPGADRMERFSRKVFVGGLPPDIDEGRGKI